MFYNEEISIFLQHQKNSPDKKSSILQKLKKIGKKISFYLLQCITQVKWKPTQDIVPYTELLIANNKNIS